MSPRAFGNPTPHMPPPVGISGFGALPLRTLGFSYKRRAHQARSHAVHGRTIDASNRERPKANKGGGCAGFAAAARGKPHAMEALRAAAARRVHMIPCQ